MEGEFCSTTDRALLVGLTLSLIGGGLCAWLIVELMNWTNPRPEKIPGEKHDNCIKAFVSKNTMGLLERFAITAIATYNLSAAGAFILAWMGLKLAANWNRSGRGGSDDAGWRYLGRRTQASLTGSLVSAGFAIAGAMMICAKI